MKGGAAMRALLLLYVVLGSIASAEAQTASTDWDSCRSQLNTIVDAASNAKRAAGDADSRRDDYENCRQRREVHDVARNGCQEAASDYESAIGDLQSKMENLDNELRAVQGACGYQFTINKMSSVEAAEVHAQAAQRRLCTSFLNLGRLGEVEAVRAMCVQSQGDSWCKACLGP